MRANGHSHVSFALTPGKRNPFYKRLSWPQDRMGVEISPPPRPPTGIQSPELPFSSKSLYRLSYADPQPSLSIEAENTRSVSFHSVMHLHNVVALKQQRDTKSSGTLRHVYSIIRVK